MFLDELIAEQHGVPLATVLPIVDPWEGMEELELSSKAQFRFVKDDNPQNNQLLLEVPGSTQSYAVNEDGYTKAMRMAGFPEAVVNKYPTELMIEPLNWGFTNRSGEMVKAFAKDGQLVAFVKPSLELVSTKALVTKLADVCGKDALFERLDHDLSFTNCSVILANKNHEWADDRIAAKSSARKGDVVVGGINFTNSLMGESALEVSGYVYRLVCSNGLVCAETKFKWSRKTEATPLMEWFEERVRACIESIDHEFQKIDGLIASPISEGHRSQVVNNVFKTYELSNAMRKQVLDRLTEASPRNMWDITNAITNVANDEDYVDNPHTIRKLQLVGGDMISRMHVCDSCFSVRRD